MQFNNATSLSWKELQTSTTLDKEHLMSALRQLVRSKLLVLGNGSKFGENAQYDLNFEFKNKKIRVNLAAQTKAVAKQESEDTHKNVEEDRKLVIQVSTILVNFPTVTLTVPNF